MFTGSVIVTQTDTTIGFVSQDRAKLDQIKQRPSGKHYIKALNSLKTLTHITRIPSQHKNRLRRMKRTTFILPNGHSYRVVRDPHHLLFLNRLKWVYTTSANLSNHPYDATFAKEHADILIAPLNETSRHASSIYRLTPTRLKRIR